MTDLAFLLMEQLIDFDQFDTSTLTDFYRSHAVFAGYSFGQVTDTLQDIIQENILEKIIPGSYVFRFTQKGKDVLQEERAKRFVEKRKEEIQLEMTNSVIQTNASVIVTNKQMTTNANRQNLLTIVSLLLTFFALVVAYLSYQNSKNDSDYVRNKDLEEKISKQIKVNNLNLIDSLTKQLQLHPNSYFVPVDPKNINTAPAPRK